MGPNEKKPQDENVGLSLEEGKVDVVGGIDDGIDEKAYDASMSTSNKSAENLAEPSDETKIKKRPYQCTFCSKSYGERHHLNDHVKFIHFKVRPHVCKTCSKSFDRPYKLKRHIMDVHGRNTNIKIKRGHAAPLETHEETMEDGEGD